MKQLTAILLFIYGSLHVAYCQAPYWQQQVNYKIDVTLNDKNHTLDGFVKMDYTNHSPDTLNFIWFHLWPNAYKNDRTAFTDQQLENGSTAFYFSNNDKRGYINRLDFKVNSATAKLEDHPQHQDIIKVLLPQPLAPGSTCKIETPFHVKLPYNFSRGGHIGQNYSITQWYPKPAVYDGKGWHPIPYLDQGEFYSEYGNFEVQLTVPKNYVVAATGNLQELSEKNWLKNKKNAPENPEKAKKKKLKPGEEEDEGTASAKESKTLHYTQNNVHDFAWFASKYFVVKYDTCKLPSGKIIDVYAFHYADNSEVWKNSVSNIKQAIITKSKWVGEYPYDVVSVVDGGSGGGMEYPTVTLLTADDEKGLDFVINHEVGHNWFYAILGSNERLHPWMDEGMNTYYDNRYRQQLNSGSLTDMIGIKSSFIRKRLPDDIENILLNTLTTVKKDQPIETSSEKFNSTNYNFVAYVKTGLWMKVLEDTLGKETFDRCMQEYYRRWQHKHPYPQNFKKVMEEVSGKNLDGVFALLNQKGALPAKPVKKDIRFTSFFNLKETDKHNYIAALPVIGFNFYDKLMVGPAIHNYSLPPSKLQFVLAPMYATKSKQLNGIGRVGYSWYGRKGQKAELSVAGSTFSGDSFTDSAENIKYLRFSKIVPSFKYIFANKNARSTVQKFVQWKTYLIQEQGLLFTRDTARQVDIITYPTNARYVNQLRFTIENFRVLYPYDGTLQIDQGDGFVRAGFTGNYFFNYVKGGGLNVRLFAGKFFYTADKTFARQFATDAYHLNMTGPKGYEDYTYSNYFYGRNEFDKLSTQQIMMRDGSFKVRTDLLSDKIGKTDNWLAAANFTTDIPGEINPLQLLPIKIPLKAFVDIGTYDAAWKKNSSTGRFLYDAGLQLSLFKNVINIYVPLLYSKVYKDYINSTISDKKFLRNIVFSIDVQNISLRKFMPQIVF